MPAADREMDLEIVDDRAAARPARRARAARRLHVGWWARRASTSSAKWQAATAVGAGGAQGRLLAPATSAGRADRGSAGGRRSPRAWRSGVGGWPGIGTSRRVDRWSMRGQAVQQARRYRDGAAGRRSRATGAASTICPAYITDDPVGRLRR